MSVQVAASPSLPVEIDLRTRKLLEAPLLRTLLKLAAPNAVVMLTQISIPLVEIYFVARMGTSLELAYLLPSLIIIGAGYGLFMTPILNAVLSGIEDRHVGAASGVLTMNAEGRKRPRRRSSRGAASTPPETA
jgi:hypothetical protein